MKAPVGTKQKLIVTNFTSKCTTLTTFLRI